MSTAYEIPLSASPQSFRIGLGAQIYQCVVRWSVAANAWLLSLSDDTGDAIVSSIPLVTGTDLLSQYAYLDFGGQLIAQTDHSPDTPPTYDNLGQLGHLYFVTP